MADGFIVRKGGVAVDITAAPSINFVSKTFDSITFTITNNDVLTADIFWEIGDSTPDENTFSLAGGATSSNQVASGLDGEETYTIFAFANAEGKAGSQTTSQVRTTPEEPDFYTAATGGTTLEYNSSGKRYKSHTFTSDGTFTVTTAGNGNRNQVDYLVIAGGAGGGWSVGGGGGAGGYRTSFGTSGGDSSAEPKVVITEQAYSVNIGSGGTPGSPSQQQGNPGVNSSALGIVSTGGGGGGGGASPVNVGQTGGSGGGGRGVNTVNTSSSGISTQGFGGGNGGGTSNNGGGGGGGGAGVLGANGNNGTGGSGGNGLANTLRNGNSETRGGGGGGGAGDVTIRAGGLAGTGGGGVGAGTNGLGGAGVANTGGGAGGGSNDGKAIQNGGSGIVIIRYEIAPSV